MRTRPAYLVIDADRARIVRSTQRWPTLYEGEFAVRIRLEIPEALVPNVVYDIEVDEPDAIGIAVEAVAIETPEKEGEE